MSDEPRWASIEEAAAPREPAPEAERPGNRDAQPRNGQWSGPGPAGPAGPKVGTARTGPLPLHPMTLTDVLDGSFKLLRANARAVLIVVAVILLPPQVIVAYASRDLFSLGIVDLAANPIPDDQLPLVIAGFVANMVGAAFAAGAISRIVAASYLGRELSAGKALRVALKRSPALFASFVLVHLLEVSGIVACGIGLLATIPFFMAMYVLVTPAIVIEEIGPLRAMRRSWALVRPRFWPVLGTALLAGLVSWMLSQVLAAGPTSIAFLVGGGFAWVLVAVGGVIATVVSTPIVTITATLLYFDARIRHEGFDLQVMAADIHRGGRGRAL